MADFKFFLNRQGIQGRKGEKGDTGFSPTISVGTDTLDEYKLIIANESNSFETPNLRGNINIQDNGGTYLRYDTETKQISAQSMDAATADTVGGVRLSTEADIVEMGVGSVVTPSDVADALPLYLEGEGAVTITQDELTSKTKIKVDIPSVNDLESRMSTAEAEIADIQTDVTNLNNNKVSKTDLATTNSAGIVKVDGTSIIADENGVISSVGGGGAGDVTASGNNVFTGDNEFKKNVTITCSDDISNPTGLIINDASQSEGHKATFNVSPTNGNLNVKTTQGAIELISPFATYIDGGQSSLSVHNNGITFTSNDVLKYYNNDGSYNYVPLVTQENIKAGENITLNKNAETGDITISSTGGGGGTGDVPIATTEVAGKVKPDGTTITVTEDGTISAVGGGSGDVTAAGNNRFTGDNTFTGKVNIAGGALTVDGLATLNQATAQYLNAVSITSSGEINATSIKANGLRSDDIQTTENKKYLTELDVDNQTIQVVDGKLHANSSYTLPTASTTQLGGVKVDGTSVTINSDGVISAVGGGSTPANMVTTDSNQTINGTKTFANGTGTVFTGTSSNSNSLIIDGDDKEIRFNSQNQSDAVIKNQGWNSANLNIGTNFNSVKITTTLYDKNGNEIVGGSGSAPDNMVTTDTDQDITGKKTIVNSDGLCFKSTNSSVTSVTARIINESSSVPNTIGKITISPDKSSGSRNGFANISYGILNDGNSSNPLYGKGGLQITPVVDDASAEARILLGSSYNGMGNIVGTTSGLTIGTGAVGSELSITSTDITFNGQSLLNSGGETPSNMVTTDTEQTITGNKTFGANTIVAFGTGSAMTTINRDSVKIGDPTNYKLNISNTSLKDESGNYTIDAGCINSKTGNINIVPNWQTQSRGDGLLIQENKLSFNGSEVVTKSPSDNEYMASMAFPSSKYIDLELGASGSKYTAPANGWLTVRKAASANDQYLQVQTIVDSTIACEYLLRSVGSTSVAITVPMLKGTVAAIFYNLGGQTNRFRFCYAEGEK